MRRSLDQDTMTQVAKVDSEHIDAGEVPELPVADPSHLDIDVDDPAGTVRVTMTKEAEEVTVRWKRPAGARGVPRHGVRSGKAPGCRG